MPKSWLVRAAETAERNRRNMRRTGFTPNGYPLWEPWEVQPVVDRYPDYRSIFPLLARRTTGATYGKAGRLGVTKHRAPAWSENELLRLRVFYPDKARDEILAAFPGRTFAAVAKVANARGIYRKRRPLVATGSRLLDQVLERARRDNLTMSDLDLAARTGTYFRNRRWKVKLDEVKHCHAARALGATIRATFR